MLIEVKRKNIFEKIFARIKKMFSKKESISRVNTENYEKDNSFVKQMEENRKLLNMQKSYERGEIKESELTEKEKNDLFKLYNEQIRELQNDIEIYNTTLKSYKEKILDIKSKLNNQQN